MPKVILTEAGEKGEKIISVSGALSIGRLPDNDIHLEKGSVSRRHAKIIAEGEQYYLVDLESGNGTLLNGLLVSPNENRLLRNNDRIVIDNYTLRFWETDEMFERGLREEEEVTDADILEVKLLKKVLDAVDQETVPSLEVLNGSAQGRRFFLTDDTEETIVGRDPDADFSINEYVISRKHAKFVKKWGGIAVIDLESKNGTYVNNRRVTEEVLHDGDRLAFGTVVFLFRNPQEINVQALGEAMKKEQPPPPKKTAVQKKRRQPEGEPEEKTTDSPQETEDILKDISSMQPAAANRYPLPAKEGRKWSPMEIGMMGLGLVILSFALLTLVNLLME